MINQITSGYPYKPQVGCFGYSTCILVKDNKKILFDTGGYNIRNVISKYVKEIDIVVISHLHFDHCSNLDLFIKRNTPIYISKKELEYYHKNKDNDLDLFSYFKDIETKLNLNIIDEEILISDNAKIIFTKGHTPGHISLVINKTILLAGDSIKTYKDYINKNNYGNAYNKEEYIKTKNKLIKSYKDIYPGHDSRIINGKIEKQKEVISF